MTELPSATRSCITPGEAHDVGRVQTDARLIEHIEHTGRAVAHGAGQLHPLSLAGRERRRGAVERQVAEP